MKKMWKYDVSLVMNDDGRLKIVHKMPRFAIVLHVEESDRMQMYPYRAEMWAVVDPDAELEERTFEWFMTGQDLTNPESLCYIKTIKFRDGLVGHFFGRY